MDEKWRKPVRGGGSTVWAILKKKKKERKDEIVQAIQGEFKKRCKVHSTSISASPRRGKRYQWPPQLSTRYPNLRDTMCFWEMGCSRGLHRSFYFYIQSTCIIYIIYYTPYGA
jgi:hypothetical protein